MRRSGQWERDEMISGLTNLNTVVYKRQRVAFASPSAAVDELVPEPINQGEIFCHLRDIKDPEHPYTLEELKVITEDAIDVDDEHSYVRVTYTPTVDYCKVPNFIGLCLRVKLMRCLPSRYKVDIRLAPGSHLTEAAVNKQLNDKDRVLSGLENPVLVRRLDECLAPSYA